MAMTWTSLSAAKGVTGSIANWVSYTKLDIPPIVDELQALIYSALRVREMKAQATLLLPMGNSQVALPTRFLDPIGRLKGVDFNLSVIHKDQSFITGARSYEQNSGSLGTDPFTTTAGASTVSVNFPAHGLNQGGTFAVYGATVVNGIALASQSFPIVSITDVNDFVIDTVSQTASGSGSGGGAAVTYVSNSLIQGTPAYFGIWDEMLKFDVAMNQDITVQLNYFQSLPLLSFTNQTNFLTNRYPQLVRTAGQAAAADFQKDAGEYQKAYSRLQALIMTINIENDGYMRGMEIETYTP